MGVSCLTMFNESHNYRRSALVPALSSFAASSSARPAIAAGIGDNAAGISNIAVTVIPC